MKKLFRLLVAVLLLSILNYPLSTSFAQGTAFTYQGRLSTTNGPATGSYDLGFVVCSGATGVNFVSSVITNTATPVSNGLFTVSLDFGAGIFTGADRWLALFVRTNGNGAFTALLPRQALTATPYAVLAGSASNVSGTVSAAQLSGTLAMTQLPASVVTNGGNIFGTFTGNGAGLTNVNSASLNGITSSGFWSTDGNEGANPSNGAFIGTTDNQPLVFKVNGNQALRLEPNATSPNVVGGYVGNIVSNGIYGAFIGSGGTTLYPNRVGGMYASVLGGFNNLACGYASTAMGHDTEARGDYSTAMGSSTTAYGRQSTALGFITMALGDYSTAMGNATEASGYASTAMGYDTTAYGDHSTAMGHSTTASGDHSTAMGYLSNASGDVSTAMGYFARATNSGSFVWADNSNVSFLTSTTNNSVTMRAAGGYRLFSNTNATAGVSLASGGTAWAVISDRNAKKDFAPINAVDILEKLAAMPVTQWHYNWENAETTPHIGPMAQDFKAAFYPGSDDKSITTLEADGVAFAAIQGLNQKLEAQRAENAELKHQLAELKSLVQALAEKR